MKMVIPSKKVKKKEVENIDIKVSGKDLYNVLKDQKKDLKKHFKKSGHDIDTDSIKEEVLYDLFGFHISDLIYDFLVDNDTELVYKYKEGSFLRKKDGYFPVYFDTYTGEIIIVENAREDKSYIMKYRESDGYEFLGPL